MSLKDQLEREKRLGDAAAGACCAYLDLIADLEFRLDAYQMAESWAVSQIADERRRIRELEQDNEIYRLANRALTQRDGSHVARAIALEAQLAEANHVAEHHAQIAEALRHRRAQETAISGRG
jgi:hypothetical protein